VGFKWGLARVNRGLMKVTGGLTKINGCGLGYGRD